MKTTAKRKFICIEPLSSIAKMRFNTEMNNIHSCYVDDEKNDILFLSSISGNYKFTMSKKNDSNWKIIK